MSPVNSEPLRLEGEMTIYRAAELKDAVLAAAALDLAAVEEIDTAGLQLLLLARREAHAAGRAWRIGARSAAVDDAIALLGLAEHLGELASEDQR